MPESAGMDSGGPGQTIPNPNQDRLGFPPPQTPEPSNKHAREVQTERAHAEALQYAEELALRARQLRDELRKANGPLVSATVKQEAEKIEKLARKLRGRLQSS